MTTTNLDSRELIAIPDYTLLSVEELVELKRSLMHQIVSYENGLIPLHHEYNVVKVVLMKKERALAETEGDGVHEATA